MDRRVFIGAASACTCSVLAGATHAQEPEEELDFCTVMPPADDSLSKNVAVNEWSGNTVPSNVSEPETAAMKAKRWNPNKRILRVGFLQEGTLADRVFQKAKGWEQHMPLRFEKVAVNNNPEILVGLRPGEGHWSALGTDSLILSSSGEQSMNFGWTRNPSESEVQRVALHEFGHAMALIHEHAHPDAGINWNLPAVYAYYEKTQGWSEEETNDNVIKMVSANELNRTSYDPTSIMHYPIPRKLVNDPQDVVAWNNTLSAADKALASWLWT